MNIRDKRERAWLAENASKIVQLTDEMYLTRQEAVDYLNMLGIQTPRRKEWKLNNFIRALKQCREYLTQEVGHA